MSLTPPAPKRSSPAFLDRHMGSPDNPTQPSTWTNLFLQPLTSIHLHSQLDSELEANGNITHVYIMGAIGVFLLLIACFNFINLSTARATSRGKEVGLRKVVGAFRQQLIVQHLSESILVALFAFLVAIVLVTLALPWLNDFTGQVAATGAVRAAGSSAGRAGGRRVGGHTSGPVPGVHHFRLQTRPHPQGTQWVYPRQRPGA